LAPAAEIRHHARVRRTAAWPLAALLLLASADATFADATPEETAYDAAVHTWAEEWAARPAPLVVDHAVCTHYWQTGDAIRTRMKAATVPASRASYQAALLAYVDAALAAADACLADSKATPEWTAKRVEAIKLRRGIGQAARRERLRLPTTWN
jgi:hypothetical protein